MSLSLLCAFPRERLQLARVLIGAQFWTTRREDSWASQSDLHGFGFSVSPRLFKVMFACSEASPASCDCTPGMSTRGTGTRGGCVSSVERLSGRFCCWLGCKLMESLVGKLMPGSPRHTSLRWKLYFTQVGPWRQLSKHKDLSLDYQHPCEKSAMVARL